MRAIIIIYLILFIIVLFQDIYTNILFSCLIDGQKLNLVELFTTLETCSGCSIESLVSTSNEVSSKMQFGAVVCAEIFWIVIVSILFT